MTALQIDNDGRRSLSCARKGATVEFNYGGLGRNEFVQSAALVITDKRVEKTPRGGPICYIDGHFIGSDDQVQVRVYRGYKSALLIVS